MNMMYRRFLFFILAFAFCYCLIVSCGDKKSKNAAIPVKELSDVIDECERLSSEFLSMKLESSDSMIIIYNTRDSIEGYSSPCVVLFNDGKGMKAITEEEWRKKFNLKDTEYCPLFSEGHREIYTISNKLDPNNPLYVIVTERSFENAYKAIDNVTMKYGLRTYAHAYRIKEGFLQPDSVFKHDGAKDYMIQTPMTLDLFWVHMSGIWPSDYGPDTRTLKMAEYEVDAVSYTSRHYYTEYQYDDQLGFSEGDRKSLFNEDVIKDHLNVAAMTEFPKHKIAITCALSPNFTYDSTYTYYLLMWPSEAKWTDKPSVVATGVLDRTNTASGIFKSKDNNAYIVNFATHAKDSPIKEIELYKGGKFIERECFY